MHDNRRTESGLRRKRILTTLLFATAALPAIANGSDLGTDHRIVVVGEVQGAAASVTKLLQHLGVIDDEFHWAGGAGDLRRSFHGRWYEQPRCTPAKRALARNRLDEIPYLELQEVELCPWNDTPRWRDPHRRACSSRNRQNAGSVAG